MTESINAKQETQYYVGRYEIANREETERVVHLDRYSNLYTSTDNFNYSEGFKEARTANAIANRLNANEKNIANEFGTEQRYHYFTYQKNNDIRALGNYAYQTPEVESSKEEVETETEE